MFYLYYAIFTCALVYIFVGCRFATLWKGSFIGLLIMLTYDYLGTKYNIYVYHDNLSLYLGRMPLFFIIGVYATSMLYLNWIPSRWDKKVIYTIYVSALFLSYEAFAYSIGAISYPNWQLWYSYFLIFSGLILMAFLSDLLNKITAPKKSS